MAGQCSNIILQTSLDVENKVHLLTLTNTHLIWEPSSTGRPSDSPTSEPLFKTTTHVVEVKEIIAVCLERQPQGEVTKSGRRGRSAEMCCIEMVPLRSNTFSIHHVKRQPKHKWKDRKVVFQCPDKNICQLWTEAIQKLVNKPEYNRPKKLLVFVNPFGGKKKGPKIYREKVAPFFDLAGISTEVIITERANHAKDMIQDYDLTKLDGLVCVGGDGMFSELLNGLLNRTQQDLGMTQTPSYQPGKSKLRIGIIPAGSTDTVAFSTTGTNDPITAALHIILGDSVGIDVTGVYHKDQFLTYNFSMLGYGYYGDVLVDSETHRWMGPKRYDWCGFKKFVSNKSYEGEVSFLLSTDTDNHPRDGTRCWAGCRVCRGAVGKQGCYPTTSSSSPEKAHLSSDGWHHVRGRFVGINSFVMSCRCGLSPEGPSPSCHLGDGCADLTLISHCSRTDYGRHLYRCIAKKADQFDFQFIQVYRVKEFSFRPLFEEPDEVAGLDIALTNRRDQHKTLSRPTHNSVWNCDGEVVEHPDITVKIYCQLINIFARGLEEPSGKDDTQCGPCGSGDKDIP